MSRDRAQPRLSAGKLGERPLGCLFIQVRLEVAELNRLRQDLDEDKTDIEWLTLFHAFCFVSYKLGDFQAYLDEQATKGAFAEFAGG